MQVFSDFYGFLAGAPALFGPVLTAAVIFLAADWRVRLSALGVQYVLVGLTLSRTIQVEVAVVKILVGVLVVAMLSLSARGSQDTAGEDGREEGGHRMLGLHMDWLRGPLGFPLRLLAVLLVALVVIRLFQGYRLAVVPMDMALVACWLAGMGLIGLVLSGDPLRVASAVLTILTGFELVFSGLEPSLAVAGFWSAFVLLSALALSALVVAPHASSHSAPGEEQPT